jgi:ornithine cyclodeaminase/alanine dehydrogenase-like protein (mu-crystallin family)
LRKAFAWDRAAGRAADFAETCSDKLLTVETVREFAPAALASDVIVTCTTAREPFLMASSVSPGTFIAAVGADSPEKNEIDPHLMAASLVVADVLDQCALMGDLHHALQTGAMQRTEVHAELGELVVGSKSGRTCPDQITMFDSTGTALQDVASAAMIYRRAMSAGGTRTVALDA